MLAVGACFTDCVFTDECTVQTKFRCIKQGDQYSRMRNRAKHPAKVHIWGGISVRGTTQFAILPGNCRIDSELYCRILERFYLPSKSKLYSGLFCCIINCSFSILKFLTLGFCRLVQDNAPPHKSRYTRDKLERWEVETVAWPPESPDLNPIELVWGNMKVCIRYLIILIVQLEILCIATNHIRKQGVRNLDDLKVAIARYWKTLTPEKCARAFTLLGSGKDGEGLVEASVGKKYSRSKSKESFTVCFCLYDCVF
ncbi:hypothetical protein COOONC_26583 [Cooperia oncophora]